MTKLKEINGKTANIPMLFFLFISLLFLSGSPSYAQEMGDERIRKATILIQGEEYAQAEEILVKVTTAEPGNLDAHYLLTLAYLGQNKFKEGEDSLKKCLQIDPQNETCLILLAQAQMEQNRLPEAKQTVEKLLTFNHKSAEGHYALGVIYYMENQPEKAVGEFNLAILSNKNFTYAYTNLAKIYYNAKKFDEAVDNMRKVLFIEDDNAGNLFLLGWIYRKMGDSVRAKQQFERASQIRPPSPYSSMQKALEAYDNKDYDKAMEAVGETLIMDPKFDRGLYMKGLILVQKEKYLEAGEIFDALLKEDKGDLDVLEIMEQIKPKLEEAKKSAGQTTTDKGKDQPTTDNGKDNPTTDKGKDQPTTDKGKDNPTTDKGKDQPTTDKGKDNPTTDKGKDNPTTDKGKDNPTTDKGKDQPTTDNGKDNPTTDENKDQQNQDQGNGQTESPSGQGQ